ncbi:Plasmodium exported protein (PHISTb), unknown, putative [Plasmodium gaboni]|uniref:Uncharacterized protein n=1 Tax=Plasmodium gaboni TaxID=647221 RepID=A0ABY0KW82_9APIC|nr:Plasmodium exported protein (PHISTb), unknown, putative [Plasmodium gaboni]
MLVSLEKFNCDGLDDYPSPIQFNNHIFRRIMSANEPVDVAVETQTEKTFNNTMDLMDEKALELYYSYNNREESEVILLEEHDILSHFLNADVSNVFSENKSLFKDLLNNDICTTYEINFDKNSESTLLTNKNDLQIKKYHYWEMNLKKPINY